jgi:hypothetical protein
VWCVLFSLTAHSNRRMRCVPLSTYDVNFPSLGKALVFANGINLALLCQSLLQSLSSIHTFRAVFKVVLTPSSPSPSLPLLHTFPTVTVACVIVLLYSHLRAVFRVLLTPSSSLPISCTYATVLAECTDSYSSPPGMGCLTWIAARNCTHSKPREKNPLGVIPGFCLSFSKSHTRLFLSSLVCFVLVLCVVSFVSVFSLSPSRDRAHVPKIAFCLFLPPGDLVCGLGCRGRATSRNCYSHQPGDEGLRITGGKKEGRKITSLKKKFHLEDDVHVFVFATQSIYMYNVLSLVGS